MELTIKSTQYLRSLPEFLKYTSEEMQERGLLKSVEILQNSSNESNLLDEVESESFDLTGPVRGTKALMQALNEIKSEEIGIDNRIEEAKNLQREVEEENLREENEEE